MIEWSDDDIRFFILISYTCIRILYCNVLHNISGFNIA